MKDLLADGERFIPGKFDEPSLVLEHYQRYYAALPLVKGKTVLDIASGSGYGSFILAKSGKQVYGVEIDQDAVDYAAERFARPNLQFLQGSVEKIPLPDRSVDVVVSFETIEHITAELQICMMKEIKRVLKEDGILFISSPDKRYYSEERGFVNPFHVHELTSGEFRELLGSCFAHIEIAGQRFMNGCLMMWEDHIADRTVSYGDLIQTSSPGVRKPHYLLAVAGDRELPEVFNSIVEYTADSDLRHLLAPGVQETPKSDLVKVYYQSGPGGAFSEKNTLPLAFPVENERLEITVDLTRRPEIFSGVLRFDFGGVGEAFALRDWVVEMDSGEKYYPLKSGTLESVNMLFLSVPGSGRRVVIPLNDDPQLLYAFPVPGEKCRSLRLIIERVPLSRINMTESWLMLKDDLLSLELRNRKLRSDLDLDSARIRELEAGFHEKERENASLTESYKTLETGFREKERENADLTESYKALETGFREKERENASLTESYKALETGFREKERENASLTHENASLTESCKALETGFHEKERENAALAASYRELEAGFREKERENATLTASYAELEAGFHEKEREIASLTSSGKALEAELRGKEASLRDLNEELQRRERQGENERAVLAGLYRAAGYSGQIQELRYEDLKDKYDELEREHLDVRRALSFDYPVMREAMEQLEALSRKALDHWSCRVLRSGRLFCRVLRKLAFRKTRLLAKIVGSNPLFDAQWYLEKYPDVRGTDPALHYLADGWREGRDPSPCFSTRDYTLQNGLQGDFCPLLHFLLFGKKEDIHLSLPFFFRSEIGLLQASPLMDAGWYLKQYPDVCGFDPVIHYLSRGWKEGRDPSAAFSTSKYLEAYPEVRSAGVNPLVHYLMIGRADGCQPIPDAGRSEDYLLLKKSRLFRPDWYRKRYPDIAGLDPIEHFLNFGWKENRDPSPEFSTSFYLENNPDIRAAGTNPLVHYLKRGAAEGRRINGLSGYLAEHFAELAGFSGLFDSEWYKERYGEEFDIQGDPLRHFCRTAWREGCDPSPLISQRQYWLDYQDLAGVNSLFHYIVYGALEGRRIKSVKEAADGISRKRQIAVLIHEASDTGAPRLGLQICRLLRSMDYFVWTIVMKPGPILEKFRRYGKVFCTDSPEEIRTIAEGLKASGCHDAIFNSVVTCKYVKTFHETGFRTVSLIHEMSDTVKVLEIEEVARAAAEYSGKLIFPAALVADSWKDAGWSVPAERARILPQGNCERTVRLSAEETLAVRKRVRRELGFPEDSVLVLACGTLEPRKAPDVFMQVAKSAYGRDPKVRFLWVGDYGEKTYREEILNRSRDGELSKYCRFIGYQKDLSPYFLSADIFFLPSKADPYPIVGLMAASYSLPLVCDARATGIAELYAGTAGLCREYSADVFVKTILGLAADPALREETAEKVRDAYSGHRSMSEYVTAILESTSLPFRKITCVVPNYNYEKYLVPRLDSIRAQTYPVYELIILDDNSPDGSDKVIRAWIGENRDFFRGGIRYIRNETNCGVFAQWRRGISMARGELVWIAEADDTCDPRLTEELIPFFDDPMVSLAYVQSRLIDSDGKVFVPDFSVNTDRISPVKWKKPYVYPFERELNSGLAIANTIPNASAVIMRKTAALKVSDLPTRFKVAGDWVFYLETLRGGRIGFSPSILNNYRRHGSSVYHRNKEQTVREIERIHRLLLESCHLGNETIRRMRKALLTDYDYTGSSFKLTLDYDRYLQPEKKDPGVLIFSGSLTYGGGEIFPIWLANEMARQGYRVYLLSFDVEPPHMDIVEKVHYRVNLVHMAEIAGKGLRNFISENGIGFVSSHFYHADKFLAGELEGTELFWTVTTHGMYEHLVEHPGEDPDFPVVFPKIFRRCSKVIYTAPKNLAPLRKLDFDISGKCVKIDNGFPYSHEAPFDRGSYGIGEKDKVLVFVARGIPEKGWEEVIALVSDLNAQRGKEDFAYHALMIGDSEYVRGLKDRFGSDPHLHFLGYRKDLAPFVAGSDIGLLPSTFIGESQPLILIEFFANGKPVVATRIGEVPLMVRQGGVEAGVLLDISDGHISRAEFAGAVRAMEDGGVYRTYSEGAKKIFEHYSIENCVNSYMDLYFKNRAGKL